MIFDTTINVGQIVGPLINIVIMVIGGFFALRLSLSVLSAKLLGLDDRLRNVESDIKALNKVVISNAIVEERISSLRTELSSFMSSQISSHTEWRAWVRRNFERVETEIKGLELQVLAQQVEKAH